MSAIWQRIVWSPNFFRQFGPWHGARLLMQLVKPLPRASEMVRSHAVPGYAALIRLRETIADHATFKQCLVKQQYDFLAVQQARRLPDEYRTTLDAGRQPLIIDGGANIGLTSLWFNRIFPDARILTIEPDADNFALLEKKTAHVRERVTPVRGGLWHRSAELEIFNPEGGAAAFRVGEINDGQRRGIPAFSIDDLCHQAGNEHPLIVKLDIEGAQAPLFSANTGWVARTDLITLELDDWQFPWQGSSHSFFRCLALHPFDYLLHHESIFCFRDEHAPPAHTHTETPAGPAVAAAAPNPTPPTDHVH